jgi:flagellar basal body-associated protein FliL
MKKLLVVLLVGMVLALFLVFQTHATAGEKEELAIKIFTLQEDAIALQEKLKQKQEFFSKARANFKSEADHTKKGEIAKKLLELEKDIIETSEKLNAKVNEQKAARAKYAELVEPSKSTPAKK